MIRADSILRTGDRTTARSTASTVAGVLRRARLERTVAAIIDGTRSLPVSRVVALSLPGPLQPSSSPHDTNSTPALHASLPTPCLDAAHDTRRRLPRLACRAPVFVATLFASVARSQAIAYRLPPPSNAGRPRHLPQPALRSHTSPTTAPARPSASSLHARCSLSPPRGFAPRPLPVLSARPRRCCA